MGVGGRPDGYAVLGRDLDHRDRQLDELLDALERTWWGEALPGADRPIGPPPLTEGPAHRARWHLGGGAERDGQPVIRGAW